ncbi:MAG: sugar phosphate isomerase/epimerase [Capsulimonadaceae bacterium]|nr:sugar phosphate isomerase/epimerase [Capsulimonadaceae bacterium]
MTHLKTKTGKFPIGFRRGGWAWQSDLAIAIEWASNHGFGVIDLGRNASEVKPVIKAGLRVGSVDLLEWQGLISADKAKRADAVARNAEFIKVGGAQNYFAVMLPEDPTKPRSENFTYMVDGLNALAPTLEAAGGRLVIEGWPGPGALCCTPETYRATFRECPSMAIGINYDPSHLLRMGIDPIRFLNEFASRVGHVHGKDTEIVLDDVYEYGVELPAAFKPNPAFGSAAWRYTIPGHGGSNWLAICKILADQGYTGAISIELEDRDYHGSDEAQQRGLIEGAQFLATC